ncbi:MAG: hypothetical protein HY699_03895 [Deltaproteobacteria bacterium]|nr:hypothetical protein [Deltaproteobacteria bacterium]
MRETDSRGSAAAVASGFSGDHPAFRLWWWLGLIAVTAGFAAAAYRVRFHLLNTEADTWVHLALIRHTMEHGWFAGDAFYADMGTPPYYSLLHGAAAAVCRLTGLAPHELWVVLPPFLIAATVAATFAWLRALTGDMRVASIGALTQLLLSAPADPAWCVIMYPRGLALVPYALALFAYLRWHERRQQRWLAAAALALGACLATHLFSGGFCALSLLFLDLSLSRRLPSLGLVMVAAGGLLLSAPWLLNVLLRWREREVLAPELFDASQPLFGHETWSISWGPATLLMYRPDAILKALPGPVWIPVALGLLLALWRWRTGTATASERFALYATFGTLLLLLTPIFGVLKTAGGVWTGRMVQVIPLALLAGAGTVGTSSLVRHYAWPGRAAALALGAGVLWGTALAVWTYFNAWSQLTWFFAPGPLQNWHLEDELAQTGFTPRVVLSDPMTSYVLPYYLGTAVVAMPPAHGSAYVDHRTRLKAVANAFNPLTRSAELFAILDRYQVDAVAIAAPRVWNQQLATQAAALLPRLQRMAAFEDTGCCTGLTILRYRPEPRRK